MKTIEADPIVPMRGLSVTPAWSSQGPLGEQVVQLAQSGDLFHRPDLLHVRERRLEGAGIVATRFLDGARWSDANVSYVAVSDIDKKDLAAFVEAFKQAHKPAAEAPAR